MLGDSPVERRAAWVVDLLIKGGDVTVEQVHEAFNERFLSNVGVDRTLQFLTGLSGAAKDGTITRAKRAGTDVTVIINDEVQVSASVESAPPHRFAGLIVKEFNMSPDPSPEVEALRAFDTCEGDPAIEPIVRKAAVHFNTVGLTLGVARGTDLLHRQTIGVGNIAAPTALTLSDALRAGSIAKVITSLGVMRLCAQGACSLDDPIAERLTRYRIDPHADADRPITIRDVLGHHAGLPRSSSALQGDVLPADAPPGLERVYSNIGFGLLGWMIAEVGGAPYGEWIAANILEPAGMTSSSSVAAPVLAVKGYDFDGTTPVEAPLETIDIDEAAGALVSTVEDLIRLSSVVKDPSIVGIPDLSEALAPAGNDPGYALGFARWTDDGRTVIWHNGGVPGWRAAWYYAPDEDLTVALMANTGMCPVDEIARVVMRAVTSN